MELLHLKLENYCGHENTELDLSQIASSAIILGKIRDNIKKSNGSGKSSLFSAIDFVLFNEVRFSAIDKVIRDGTDYCRVSIIIKSDNNLFKIVRSRTKKSSDLRIYKDNNGNWDDITQRRVSDNEKELSKILKINYKTFLSSVVFSQSRSETPAQLEFSDIACLTPEKRKSLLKEILQLTQYSKYEKLTKKKISDTTKEIDKNSTILETLGNPKQDLLIIETELSKLISNISELEVLQNNFTKEKQLLTSSIEETNHLKKTYQNTIIQLKKDLSEKHSQLNNAKNNLFSINTKIDKLISDGKTVSNSISNIKEKISYIENIPIIKTLDTDLKETTNNLIENNLQLQVAKLELQKLLIPLEDGEECKYCRQKINVNNLQECKKQLEKDINNCNIKIININEKIVQLNKIKSNFELEINKQFKNNKDLDILKNELKSRESELLHKRELFSELSAQKNKCEDENNFINKTILEIEKKLQQDEANIFLAKLEDNLISLNKSNTTLNEKINNNLEKILQATNQKSVLLHKKQTKQEDLEKIISINSFLTELNKQNILLAKVQQAFGSNGIPSLIINNIVDELQTEANIILSKLRPGIQLQFILNKDEDVEKDETLDITYFIDGFNREYRQLSGAQKVIVSLCLKIALLSIVRKKIGVDIKFLLLDEVDQAWDDESIDAFFNIIKSLEQEYKLFIITHNNDLKCKFNDVILVEQNQNNVSTATLTKNW